MSPVQEKAWRAGRFWWDCTQSADPGAHPLRALIFDLDAMSDLDLDGHRVVFNAAFAAHGLPLQWSPARYRQLLALRDERQRVGAELRKRCVGPECDVLVELLADEICATKDMIFDEMILDLGLSPRAGLVDLVMDAFAQNVPVGVVSGGRRRWVEPLVRQLVGDGLVDVIVTGDDVSGTHAEAFGQALAELGVAPHDALGIAGSAAGLRAANAAGLAPALVGADPDVTGPAVTVRADYTCADGLRLATCRRLLAQWWAQHSPSAA
ncbi:HAD family hydrolase [Mycolicibacterium goodii]|uniref:Haloacid dehalogenase n=1 Tax=Mycolicibacterium goodii TaxID=134601 RepID=A0A0K0XE67_MYCGD|nr:haloacid dehalogenase [Mycolicibacterium goodii]